MTKFVLLYQGPKGMGDTPEQQRTLADAWTSWYQTLGNSIIDGGNPFGASNTIGPSGAIARAGSSELTGYTIISADSLETANQLAMGCPVLKQDGRIEIYEALDF